MHFEVVGKIEHIETIAIGGRIRDIMRLKKQYGQGRWRKLKGQELYALCISNKEREDLVVRKIYKVLDDKKAKEEGYLRVIDESGEDYIYPESYFIFIDLPLVAQQALELENKYRVNVI